jgi:SAM-dependent methyltransferase
MASYGGRFRARPLRLDAGKIHYINLGSGTDALQGFINIDFFTTAGIDYGTDLRYPLMIEDEAVDGIFCEHTLEHLNYREADSLLKDCRRILKPGGAIRIVVPDLSLFLRNYCERNGEWFREWERLMFRESVVAERLERTLGSPLEAISFVTQEYGHSSSWDFETLRNHLERSGFLDIVETSFRKGRCERLLVDMDAEDRKFVSLYVEAVK